MVIFILPRIIMIIVLSLVGIAAVIVFILVWCFGPFVDKYDKPLQNTFKYYDYNDFIEKFRTEK